MPPLGRVHPGTFRRSGEYVRMDEKCDARFGEAVKDRSTGPSSIPITAVRVIIRSG
jgi:hypothetical protein